MGRAGSSPAPGTERESSKRGSPVFRFLHRGWSCRERHTTSPLEMGLQHHQANRECHGKRRKREHAGEGEAAKQPLPPRSVLAPLLFEQTLFFPSKQSGIVVGQPFDVQTQHQEPNSLVEQVVFA